MLIELGGQGNMSDVRDDHETHVFRNLCGLYV